MSDDTEQDTGPIQPRFFEIRIRGHLDEQWTDWFGGLTITLEESGDTLLTGPVPDQAALFGLLRKVRDLGMQLISVNGVDSGRQEALSDKHQHKERSRTNERTENSSQCS